MTERPVVRVQGVSKRYWMAAPSEQTVLRALLRGVGREPRREAWALRDVSFEVRAGEGLGVIGLNGAGKTTLLSIIAGITAATEGEVDVLGSLRSPYLGIGTGAQPELTVEDNVRLCGALLGLTGRELDDLLPRILAFGGLEPYRRAKLQELSTGYQQRVAFATALHADSDVVLVDETLAVGDEPFRCRCRAAIDRLRERGRTMILVSHEMAEVRRMCERALCLEGGQVRAVGDVKTVTRLFEDDCRRRAS